MKEGKRIVWLDFAKLMAILAVLVDHTVGYLYSNADYQVMSFYSVCTFVLCMGVTTEWSYEKNTDRLAIIRKKVLSIFVPYTVATFLYLVYGEHSFVFADYMNRLIHFNANPPFYYVLLYIQLALISPILHTILNKTVNSRNKVVLILLILLVLFVLSYWLNNYTDILGVIAGGGKLFGGSYIVLLFIGMLFGKIVKNKSLGRRISFVGFLLCFSFLLIWVRFLLSDRFAIEQVLMIGYINPPGICLITYSILVVLTIYFLDMMMKDGMIAGRIIAPISKVGRHTLYIFLYHYLVFTIVRYQVLERFEIILSPWLKRAIVYSTIIVGCILIEIMMKKIGKWICGALTR